MRLVACVLIASACGVDFSKPKAPDEGLAQRIAQRKNDLLQNPDNVKALIELGELQVEAGQMFEAADTLVAAKNTGSDDIRIHAGLTQAYLELGYMKSGVESLRTCIEKDRSNPDCLFAYGKLLEPDQSDRSRLELRQVWLRFLEVAPNHRRATYVRSSLDQIEGQLANMKAPPEEPSSQPSEEPQDPPPVPGHPGGTPEENEDVGELNELGQAFQKAIAAVKRGDAPGAEAAFREALKLAPDDPGATAGLAEALFAQGKLDEAVKTIEKAYQLDPKDSEVRWAFGMIMERANKRIPDAIAAWEALIAADPEYAGRLGIPKRLEELKKR
jgi:tetratricopeptide (TPR) repeat protein